MNQINILSFYLHIVVVVVVVILVFIPKTTCSLYSLSISLHIYSTEAAKHFTIPPHDVTPYQGEIRNMTKILIEVYYN